MKSYKEIKESLNEVNVKVDITPYKKRFKMTPQNALKTTKTHKAVHSFIISNKETHTSMDADVKYIRNIYSWDKFEKEAIEWAKSKGYTKIYIVS